mgnify:CR=1 FL=1
MSMSSLGPVKAMILSLNAARIAARLEELMARGAGSLRDDGPLPETITDMNAAQDAYQEQLRGAGLVLCLGSMLHSIATGNMLPSWVKIVCVDINPAVVTKLADRGSSQTVGFVTDVGLFLQRLAQRPGWFVPVGKVLDYIREQQPAATLTESARADLETRWLRHKIFYGTA